MTSPAPRSHPLGGGQRRPSNSPPAGTAPLPAGTAPLHVGTGPPRPLAMDPAAVLADRDPVLRRIIGAVGACRLRPRRDHFVALCQAIISQQLSTAVARVICERFRALFPRRKPTPDALLALPEETLRGVGLSRQKCAYLRDLAGHISGGTIPWRRLSRLSDDELIAALTQVHGIGVWTAQMFLIFVLHRPDVLPVDDLGLRKAVQKHYGLENLPGRDDLTARGEAWRPYRSVATWYLWQSLNAAPDPA